MDSRLLQLFEEELTHVRRMADEFRAVHPQVADRLLLAQDPPDPYVQHLLDGFAYLAARVQLQLSAEYPQFVESILNAVFPHYLAPRPSMAIVAVEPEWGNADLARAPVLPAGTRLSTRLMPGDVVRCHFVTAHDLPITPLRLVEARYFWRDMHEVDRGWAGATQAAAAIRLRLQATAGLRINQIEADRLSLYLRPRENLAALLFENFVTQAGGVVLQSSSGRGSYARLPPSAIRAMGMDRREALLPVTDAVFSGYRLLQEYFAFPARYLFIELAGLKPAFAACPETEIDIVVPLRRAELRLEKRLQADCFALHCTPAINLFRVDNIMVDARRERTEHPVVADKTKPLEYEIHSIERVIAQVKSGPVDEERHRFYPFFYNDAQASRGAGYFSTRRVNRQLTDLEVREGPVSEYLGTDMYLSLERKARMEGINRIQVSALCSNRHVPMRRPDLEFETDIGIPVTSIRTIAKTKPRLPPHLGRESWRAISHLSLNLRSLLGDEETGAKVIRELLRLYVPHDETVLTGQVESLRQATGKPIFRRMSDSGPVAYARGMSVRLDFDEDGFKDSGSACGLGLLLDQFLSRYVSINSFVETEICTRQRGLIYRCPPSNGKRGVL